MVLHWRHQKVLGRLHVQLALWNRRHSAGKVIIAAGSLALVAQVQADADLTSPLLPGFACPVADLFVAAN